MGLPQKTTGHEIANPVDTWDFLQRQCRAFLESGFLPGSIKTVAQALTIAWKGHELGIPPLSAFSLISVVKGRPVLHSELALALVYKRVPGAHIAVLTPPQEQHLHCTVEARRPGGKTQTFTFSMDDAKRANLLEKDNWKGYPPDMLRARAIGRAVKAVFPDALIGKHQELAAVEIGEDSIETEVIEPQVEVEALPPVEDEAAAEAVDKMIAEGK